MLRSRKILPIAVLVTLSAFACVYVESGKFRKMTRSSQISKVPIVTSSEPVTDVTTKVIPNINNTYDVWVPNWDLDSVFESLSASSNKLTSILPVWYVLNTNGVVVKNTNTEEDKIKSVVNSFGIKVIPTIQNNFDPKRVHDFLTNPAKMNTAISYLVTTALTERYQGWDLDWEEISESDKDFYVEFIKKLHTAMQKENLTLSVTVHAQTNTSSDWSRALGHDWPGIGKNADQVRLMIYDYHSSTSAAGAITPIKYLRAVLAYAEKALPREKTIVALPFYGYNWVEKKGQTVEYKSILNLVDLYKPKTTRDSESMEMYFTYDNAGKSHVVWYQDATSVLEKIGVAESLGYSRFCFWRLGGEDMSIWEKL